MLFEFKYSKVDIFRIPRLLEGETFTDLFYSDLEEWLCGKVKQFVVNREYDPSAIGDLFLSFVCWGDIEVCDFTTASARRDIDLLYFQEDRELWFTSADDLISGLLLNYEDSGLENAGHKERKDPLNITR